MERISGPTKLRRLGPGDLELFQAYRNDPVVARFQSWGHMDDARALGFLQAMANFDPLFQPGHWTQIGVADTETNSLIGDMGLCLSADQTEAELGITIARPAQRQGHGLRAVHAACELLFDTTPIQRINAWADVRNTASRALMERAGFTFMGFETNDGVEEAAFSTPQPVVV